MEIHQPHPLPSRQKNSLKHISSFWSRVDLGSISIDKGRIVKRYAFIFPGQGAQYPGMGRTFYDTFSVSKQVFEEADDLLERNLSKIIFEGPDTLLTETQNSQLGIFVVSMAILRAFQGQYPHIQPVVTSGLSLGEYSALVAAQKLSFQEALFVVRDRGALMQEACQREPGSMAVCLGLTAAQVDDVVGGLDLPNELFVANYNCPGQIVISGKKHAVDQGIDALKQAGAKRCMPLNVAGAFHSGLMLSAEVGLADSLKQCQFKESPISVVLNVPGDFVQDMSVVPNLLQKQVTHSVRWEQGVRQMENFGVDQFIELGCGTVLAGLNRKIKTVAPTLSVDKVEDLKKFEEIDA